MEVSQMKSEVGIDWFRKGDRLICFYGTPDAAGYLAQFGHIDDTGIGNRYLLTVDVRFSFDEVMAYIEQTY